MSAHTKGKSWVEFDAKWPFPIHIEPDIVRMDRVALSSQQKTLDDLRSAVGFKHSERQAIIDAIKKQEANAELIAEAFSVATETGLTPRQLAEQRAELLEALQELLTEASDGIATCPFTRGKARAAIAKATGATP